MNTSTIFTWDTRVYYEDTDIGGVVYYANYLKFFERARAEYFRAVGVEQKNLAQSHNVMFVVKHASIDYHAPATLDDALNITVTIKKFTKASLHFLQTIQRESTLLTTGSIIAACVRADTFRPCAIPPHTIQAIQQYSS